MQFVLVSASVWNTKNSNTQSVTKEEIPQYQAEQNPTYQIHCLKKETNKKIFAKADFLVKKILSCPRIKLSASQTLIFSCMKTGVLLSDFAHQLRFNKADVRDTCFTLLDAAGLSPTPVFNQNAKERGSWVPFKI